MPVYSDTTQLNSTSTQTDTKMQTYGKTMIRAEFVDLIMASLLFDQLVTHRSAVDRVTVSIVQQLYTTREVNDKR